MAEFDLKPEELRTEEQVLAAFKKVKESDKTIDGAGYIPILVDGNVYNEATLRTLEYFFGSMPIDDEGNYQDWIQAPESKHALAALVNSALGNGESTAKTIELSAMILTAIPVIVAYPFVQKFFTKGVMVGSVKG